MKTKTIFKRRVNLGLLFSAVMLTAIVGCQKGTFDVNKDNPNSPTSVPPQYSLKSSLVTTAAIVQGGTGDVLNNWMGYWTQSGGFTPSTTYVLYQITSSDYTGNFDAVYLNLANYNLLLKTANAAPNLANYKAIATIMQVFMYQRLVDLYNSVPYSAALSANSTFSYKYDDPATIYKSLVAKCDSAAAIIDGAPSGALVPASNFDVLFQGNMDNWKKFAKTMKLKLLMRETENGLGTTPAASSAAVKAALGTTTAADYLTVDAAVTPGYSANTNGELNPFYYDIVANNTGLNGLNTVYYRANSYAVKFYQDHNDPRVNYIYAPSGQEAVKYTSPISDITKVKGRAYGSNNGNGESNTVISGILGTGFTAAGAQKGPAQPALLLPYFETAFLIAEATERGFIAGNASAAYFTAVEADFKFLGLTSAAATTYTAQADIRTNYATATNKIELIVTQKWAAMNSIDALESYSDWRRTGYPLSLPVSAYPGVSVTHIPYRLPYPVNETTLNGANVPAGGKGTDLFTSKIFWMK
ncbi:SusD/RagB family nutrient-binding outer membrane lipoprotein [Mucilaginibacter sp. AW1-7]|uniref:SusD/RagB family nutrient-binding outer membrane lipoprotein n=1 Tax=Mucilaginibacter sp. AW1-7 TaxID=3349874 RepID=UPI003F73AEFF